MIKRKSDKKIKLHEPTLKKNRLIERLKRLYLPANKVELFNGDLENLIECWEEALK